jgi:hypothetical protein
MPSVTVVIPASLAAALEKAVSARATSISQQTLGVALPWGIAATLVRVDEGSIL